MLAFFYKSRASNIDPFSNFKPKFLLSYSNTFIARFFAVLPKLSKLETKMPA
ncbi:hypothetical protein [Ignatzschineria sp. LJL83]